MKNKKETKKPCPVCGNPMLRYENPDRWVCISVKAHDKAMISRGLR